MDAGQAWTSPLPCSPAGALYHADFITAMEMKLNGHPVPGAIGPMGPRNVPHVAKCSNCGAGLSFHGVGVEETAACICGNRVTTQVDARGFVHVRQADHIVDIVVPSHPAPAAHPGISLVPDPPPTSAEDILEAYDGG